MDQNCTFESSESIIKKAFKIDPSDKIDFIFINLKEDDDDEVQRKSSQLKKFKPGSLFRIENKNAKKNQKGKLKYFYQTNKDETVKTAELDQEATVKDLKDVIMKRNDVQNLESIKIIFAGKELINDIILKSLEIGDAYLFVYIKYEEDILLMTAKALQFNFDSFSDDIEEEEEEIENDD